jgi:hypothetical protein
MSSFKININKVTINIDFVSLKNKSVCNICKLHIYCVIYKNNKLKEEDIMTTKDFEIIDQVANEISPEYKATLSIEEE